MTSATRRETAVSSQTVAAGRVLFVGNFLSQGGGRRAVCEELAERLAAAGWSVLLTSGVRAPLLRAADMLRTLAFRRSEYDVGHVDVFSGNAFWFARMAARALRMAGKPSVLTLRGGDLPRFAAKHPNRVRATLALASAVTAPSPYLQKALAPYRSDITVVPNALEIGRYPFRIRRGAGPRLIWLRAFHGVYRPLQAVEVAAQVRNEFPDVKLTMIGPDKGDGSLDAARRAAARRGVSDRVEFVQGVPKAEVPERLAGGDIFLNTTGVDNVPVSVLEAMACGLCVVSTDAGGLPDLLTDGRNASIVPADDTEAMSRAVLRLLRDPALAERLSRGGRALAEALDWSVVLKEWTGLFAAVIARSPREARR